MERYVRFNNGNKICFGLVKGDIVAELIGEELSDFKESGIEHDLSSLKLLAPCNPTKAVCVGLNYKDTVLEPGAQWPKEPLLFIKPSTSITNPGDDIIKWAMTEDLAFEAELAIVIGKKAHLVPEEEAHEYIWGYTIANDVTAKDLQRADTLWTRSKSFDTFLPLGPWIVSGIDAHNLMITSSVNGQQKQKGTTADLIFGIEYLVSFVSHITTLLPGDIILTGTPGGYGSSLDVNDKVEIEISEIGKLMNTCKVSSERWSLAPRHK
ncbi:2-keto-4-pentenoate hydratase/2-oxohepta-3-ene-1,7-dioic acid hydratase [Desulfitobacterium dehalogenans ATCC 51507]|uniref:2-keto-4-pentenoate hydratase/2-oxohepta-3-ene-1,7-dioic acid hydratase n=1 Tax=Desulfitobacterium dehalogenans (strain ATCC 51507 / DSM 9161 / JW/IU-DC1) TaxID=756499 RepID=I4A4A2_DESDJ|nr:fumarylacetoacetate hydrolase family protein [Desulfitobacterium dehalogenans]AFL98786.1 2-keto-4-pentenoate hydratase/2-oxohepta-3-ene-1,7-dioic acid hydratase [Desulfitobacterium dehalogenans ATCC 51507]